MEFSGWAMSGEGKGKVMYVGGWALRKVMEKARKYIKNNMTTTHEKTLAKNMDKVNLIQYELLVQHSTLSTPSIYQDALTLTEDRQYRERGLLNISDEAFEFFMLLEQKCVQ